MLELNEKNILETLKKIQDPDLHKDIVSLGFVKNLQISGNDIKFDLELTTPSCPIKDKFVLQCKQVLYENIKDIGKMDIKLTANVKHNAGVPKEDLLRKVKNTIAVASGKGGVGKSTIAVNLAVALAMDGAKVGLLDADIYGPSIPLMFGIDEKPLLVDKKLVPLEKYGVKIMSIGFLVNPMDAVIWRGPMVSSAIKQFISDVEWGELDYLIFDMPPGTGDVQLTLVQTIPLTGAVIVTTPQDVALADATKGLVMFNKVNVPVLGIIENMSYYICSHCNQRENIFDNGGGKRTAEELNVPFLGEVPIDTKIRIGGDKGTPIVYGEQSSAQSQTMQNIARKLAAQISIQYLGTPQKPNVDLLINE